MLSKEVAEKIIEDNEDAIESGDFYKLYEYVHDLQLNRVYDISQKDLTEFLIYSGIDPLDYMNSIPNNYLEFSNITEISIPSNITEIGDQAFSRSNIYSVKIPGSVKTIKGMAFSHCKNLEELYIENGVEIIEMLAFSTCENLKLVHIPKSISNIDYRAFQSIADDFIVEYEGSKEEFIKKFLSDREIFPFYDTDGMKYTNAKGFKDAIRKIDSHLICKG